MKNCENCLALPLDPQINIVLRITGPRTLINRPLVFVIFEGYISAMRSDTRCFFDIIVENEDNSNFSRYRHFLDHVITPKKGIPV